MHCDAYKYGDATYNIGLLDNLSSYNVLLLPRKPPRTFKSQYVLSFSDGILKKSRA